MEPSLEDSPIAIAPGDALRLPALGVSAFERHTDAELLAALLAPAQPGCAAEGAAALVARFGSLAGALCAEPGTLDACFGAGVAARLAAVREAARRLAGLELAGRAVISSWSALLAYVRVDSAWRGREAFRVLFLDRKNRLILDEVLHVGTIDHAPVYPREVMRRALELCASSVILVHNHPSGDPTPSGADVDMTRRVVEAGKALQIAVHDHLVVGREGTASFKALGLI